MKSYGYFEPAKPTFSDPFLFASVLLELVSWLGDAVRDVESVGEDRLLRLFSPALLEVMLLLPALESDATDRALRSSKSMLEGERARPTLEGVREGEACSGTGASRLLRDRELGAESSWLSEIDGSDRDKSLVPEARLKDDFTELLL